MSELEQHISKLPLPQIRPEFCQQLESTMAQNRPLSKDPRLSSMPVRTFLATATLFFIGVFVFLPHSKKSLVFADAQNAVRNVRTIQYLFRSIHFEGLDSIPVRQSDGSVSQISDIFGLTRLRIQELQLESELEESTTRRSELVCMAEKLAKHVKPEQGKIRFAFLARGTSSCHRRERFFPDNRVWLEDHSSATHLSMLSVPETAVEALGIQVVEGREAIGFRWQFELNEGIVYRDYWVSAETGLPIRVEISWRKTLDDEPKVMDICSNFVFDRPFDDKLFDKNQLKAGDKWSAKLTAQEVQDLIDLGKGVEPDLHHDHGDHHPHHH